MKFIYSFILVLIISTYTISANSNTTALSMFKHRYIANKIGTSVIMLAKKKLGKRYVWGAKGLNTFDCSGLTYYVYRRLGIRLPRRAIAQSRVGMRVSRRNLQKGDLIFFDTSRQRKGYVNHVGIYIGNNKFIHASSAKKKVVISSLGQRFYSHCFKGARRMSLYYLLSGNEINMYKSRINTLLNYF